MHNVKLKGFRKQKYDPSQKVGVLGLKSVYNNGRYREVIFIGHSRKGRAHWLKKNTT